MILAVLLGFATLAVVSSIIGDDETETPDPGTEEDGLRATGSEHGDLLEGGAGDDRFFGKGGADLIIGLGGDDALFGGDDSDSILGGAGNDILRGGAGDDLIVDGDGADTLNGGTGDDLIISAGVLDDAALGELIKAQDPDQPNQIDLSNLAVDLSADTDMMGDKVSGGYGDDTLLVGSNDTVTAGEGMDDLLLGDWVSDAGPVTLIDFSKNEDTLVYAYDEANSPPTMTVETTTDRFGDPDDALLLANGQLVAIIEGMGGVFGLDDVTLTSFRATA